jgi:hypothetical protein
MGPIARCGIRDCIQKVAEYGSKIRTSPSGSRDHIVRMPRGHSCCFLDLTRRTVAAGKFSASMTPRCRPESRARPPVLNRSLSRRPPATRGFHPFPCRVGRLAERSGHITRRTKLWLTLRFPVQLLSPVEGFSGIHLRPDFRRLQLPFGCPVVGFSSKRLSPPLTVARSHSAPSLHGHYPFLRYYGLSDSR